MRNKQDGLLKQNLMSSSKNLIKYIMIPLLPNSNEELLNI